MRVLITGLNGTLGPRVAARARALGWQVDAWDRQRTDPEDAGAGRRLLESLRPDAIVHLALGSVGWTERLAAFAAGAIPFVFVSTAMVFHHEPDGPHRTGDAPTARDEYGQCKVRCERAVASCNALASIARIGWQMDPSATGNNMPAQLDRWQAELGGVRASRLWTPACSFMDDTACALLDLVARPQPGIVHLDSNAVEAHRFDRIVGALKQSFGKDHWDVRVTDEYRHDQRLLGGEERMPRLSARLPALNHAPGAARDTS